jgi:ribosomal protein L25 (general stress protein Ctc)
MEIKNILKFFVDYYNESRGRGHTSAMLYGALSKGATIIFSSKEMSKAITHGYPNVLSLSDIDIGLKGAKKAIVFDNYTLQIIFSQAYNKIDLLEKEIENLKLQRKEQKGK